jgi:hypothetical protein
MKQGENSWEGLKSYFYTYVGCTRLRSTRLHGKYPQPLAEEL